MARPGVAGHRGRHEPDRTGAADQDVLAEERKGERGMDRVAERIEDRGDILVDARPVVPDVRHRQDNEFGEGPVAPDAEPDGVGTQVAATSETMAAPTADHVALATDEIARVEVRDVGADFDDLADELVADDQGRLDRPLCPGIPRLDVRSVPQMRSCGHGRDVVDTDARFRDVAGSGPGRPAS
jgi:hypothetical protein